MPLMQFNIELLPAPLGPIIAFISCFRTENELSVIALTPPKLKDIFLTSKIGLPIGKFLSCVISTCRFVIYIQSLLDPRLCTFLAKNIPKVFSAFLGNTKIKLFHFFILEQIFSATFQHDMSSFYNVAVIGIPKGNVGILLSK